MTIASPNNGADYAARQLLNIFAHSTHLGYLTLTEEAVITALSPNLSEILGDEKLSRYLGQPLTDLFGEFVGAEDGITAVLRGAQSSYKIENVARPAADDDYIYLTLTLYPFPQPSGKIDLMLMVEHVTEIGRLQQRLTQQRNLLRQEVTRREEAEDALQLLNQELERRVELRTAELAAANQRLRLLEAAIAHTTDTVVITEVEPQSTSSAGIVYVNDAFSKATGYTYQEIVGKTRQMFYGPNTDPQQLEKIREALLEQTAVQVELINYRKDGTEFWVDMTIAPINTENGEVTHYVSIERDATKRKQLEDALLQSQKMEAIGLLAGGIAHDFNNMLTIVNSYSDLLLRRFRDDESAVRYINPIFTASKRAAELTAKLLAFSRRQLLSLQEISLNEVIEEVLQLIERPIGEDIQFTTLMTPLLWNIRGDSGQLSQVILNLIMNARESMPQGGMIVIETDNFVLKEPNQQISPQIPPGAYSKITIQDTGEGISSDDLPKIFDPFFTTKEMGKGTGLGLSTTYGIIAQLGGGVHVESTLSKGTTFEIFLPALANTPKRPRVQASDEIRKQTILLVEDDEGVRDLLYEGLSMEGFKVLQANNSDTAQAVFSQYPDAIDLLITDIIMPGTNGFELSELLCIQQPSLAVLYITGYSETILSNHGLRGGENILAKPFTIDKLITRVSEIFLSRSGN